jgi:hypothetical protein
VNAPAKKEERELSRFRLVEWIVPPVVIPLFLLVLAIAAVALHG